MAIAAITEGDLGAIDKLNAAIEAANDVEASRSGFPTLAYRLAQIELETAQVASARKGWQTLAHRLTASERAIALSVSRNEFERERAERRAGDTAIIDLIKGIAPDAVLSRPGDSPSAFTASLAGGPSATLAPLTAKPIGDSDGLVIRQFSAGVVAMRRLAPIERNRSYRVRFAVRRRVNAHDPSNDTVRCAVLWLNASLQPVGPASVTVINDFTALTTAQGRQEVTALVARVSGPEITAVAPAGTRYARAFVECFGGAQATDIEIVDLVDVTDAAVWTPDVAGLSTRVGAIESLDAGDRLDALEAAVDAPFTLTFATRAAAEAATIPGFIASVRTLGYSAAGDGGGALHRAGLEPAHEAWFEDVGGRFWENVEGRMTPEMTGATGGSDDTAAVERAITTGRPLDFMDGRTYKLREIEIPSFIEINIGHAFLQPAAGADYILGSVGPANEFMIRNGNLSDPDNITLRETTLAFPIVGGATSIIVADASDFAVGDLVFVISDEVDGGGKFKVHHTGISAKSGSTLTLLDPFPYLTATAGNGVYHTKGLIFIDGPTIYTLRDLAITTAPMIGTLRGATLGTTGSGSLEVANIRYDAIGFGGFRIEHDVAQSSFTGMVGYGNPTLPHRPAFGLSFDSAGETVGTSGDHYIDRVRILAMQHGIVGRRWLYGFLQSFIADNCYGAGLLLDRASDIYAPEIWVQYNQMGISMRGNSRMIVAMLQSDLQAPWAGAWDIEVEDGSALYVNQACWSGSKIIRDTVGWSKSNVYMMTGPLWLEDGGVEAPGLAWRLDPTTGIRRSDDGEIRFVSLGVDTLVFNAGGIRPVFGSAAIPSYGFAGADGTGLYAISDSAIGFASDGQLVGYVSPSGFGLSGGTWNTPHLLLGSFHLWVDNSGRLRIKLNAPSSPTDGTVVGAQA